MCSSDLLGVTVAHDGLALDASPFGLLAAGDEVAVARGPRVGITQAADLPWRYGLAGSRFLSRRFAEIAPASPSR